MDFAIIKPALVTLINALTSDTEALRWQTIWRDQQQPFVNPAIGGIVRLSIGSVVGVGQLDEIRAAYVTPRDPGTDGPDDPGDPGDELEDTVCAVRRMTLRINAEGHDQRYGLTAWQVLERVRNRLSRRSSGEALRAVGLSFLDASPTQDLSMPRDDRQASIAALDVRCNVAIGEIDPVRYQYIEIVKIAGTVTEGDSETPIEEFTVDGSA